MSNSFSAAHAAGLAGSAFDVDLGADYDVVLVPNFAAQREGTLSVNAADRPVFAVLRD
jgi:hypothetical protein